MKTCIGMTTSIKPMHHLWIFFGIFNHMKHFVSLWITRQLFFCLIYSRIQYGIDAYRSCAKEVISKLQIIHNNVLKLLRKWDRHTPIEFVHHRLSILKVNDVHSAKILSYVSKSQAGSIPDIFDQYLRTRERGLNSRNTSSLDIPWARADMGLSHCYVNGAQLWNKHLQTRIPLLYKNSFHKQISEFFIPNYD